MISDRVFPEVDAATMRIWRMSRAVASGDLRAAQELVAEHRDVLSGRDGGGLDWMNLAAEKGRAQMIRWLAKEGLSPNAENHERQFPLWRALVQSSSYDAAKALLECGADVHKYLSGSSLLHDLLGRQTDSINEVLMPLTTLLLDHGITVDERDLGGETPLFLAVLYERTDVAFLLIERGADPFSNINKKLLERACEEGMHAEVDEVMAYAHSRAAKAIIAKTDDLPTVRPLP